MRIATFNLQNLRLRNGRLDGAQDIDVARMRGVAPDQPDPLAEIDRDLTAQVIRDAKADLLAVQEVFDLASLDHFHQHHLRPLGLDYPYRHCLPGNDGRGFDVGLLSVRRLDAVESHASLTPAELGLDLPGQPDDRPIFRRDVLKVRCGALTLFICHFKAPYPDLQLAWQTRRAEALALRRLIERSFEAPERALWLVIGDLNEPVETDQDCAIQPLLGEFSEDLVLRRPEGERWSYHESRFQIYGRPDKMLASPALAARWPQAVPDVIRSGMSLAAERNDGPHLAAVGYHRPHASDHAALAVTLPGL